jgi:hypothetical protein
VFRSRLRVLGHLPFQEWREPQFKRLHGECKGLGEIRFPGDNVEQRPLGFVSGPWEFTLLFWAIEKNGRFVPASACGTAQNWMGDVIADRTRAADIWFALQ